MPFLCVLTVPLPSPDHSHNQQQSSWGDAGRRGGGGYVICFTLVPVPPSVQPSLLISVLSNSCTCPWALRSGCLLGEGGALSLQLIPGLGCSTRVAIQGPGQFSVIGP